MRTWSYLLKFALGILLHLQYFILLLPFTSFCMPAVSVTSTGKKLPPVYWNNTNPIFSASSDNKITVNMFDSIDVYCPFYRNTTDESTWEYYVIYYVTEEEYNTCTVTDPQNTVMIINCSDPANSRLYFTIWIDPFTGFPNSPDFQVGDSKYIISTPIPGKPGGLVSQAQGPCQNRNMRLKINICCSTNSSTTDSTTKTSTINSGHNTQSQSSSHLPSTTTTRRPTTPRPTTHRPTTTSQPTSTTRFPGGRPSDPTFIIEATGSINSGQINNALTLWPSHLTYFTVTIIFLISWMKR